MKLWLSLCGIALILCASQLSGCANSPVAIDTFCLTYSPIYFKPGEAKQLRPELVRDIVTMNDKWAARCAH